MMTPPSEKKPSAFRVRDAGEADGAELSRLLGKPFEAAGREVGAGEPRSRAWVAELDAGGVVGLVGLRMTGEHAGEIHDLWVSPDHRGCGVGVGLMETCLGYCRAHGVLKTSLEAEENQTAAIRLFQKVGFLLSRKRRLAGGERLEFYMDLYRDEKSTGRDSS